jgi:type I restriction enzyme S subunit
MDMSRVAIPVQSASKEHKRPPGSAAYKQTELGFFPAAWEVVLLESVAKRGSGHTPDKKHPEYWNGRIKWVSLADSDRLDDIYIYETSAYITPAGLANSSAVLHPPGTVILSRDAGVGKSAIMADEMAVSQHFMAWQCGPRLHNHYFYYWLQSEKAEFERIANGNTIKTIGLPFFKNLKIPLPPLSDQQAIAAALGDVDALTGGLTKLLAKKRAIKLATMQQLLTGKMRLLGQQRAKGYKRTQIGSVPIDWSVASLSKFADIRRGASPRPINAPVWYDANSAIGWVRISDVARSDGKYLRITRDYLSDKGVQASRYLESGSLIMSICATVGLPIITAMPSCIHDGFVAFIGLRGIDLEFLYYVLKSLESEFQAAGQTGSQSNLNTDLVKNKTIAYPPPAEQRAIATVLANMDAEIAALERRRDKTKAIKQGMMQALLTGRIRLVKPEVAA